MKKLTKIIGTLLTVVTMTACNSNYKEITVEEADAKCEEITKIQSEKPTDQVTIKYHYVTDGKFTHYADPTSGVEFKSSYGVTDRITTSDSKNLFSYRKETQTSKVKVVGDHDDVDSTQTEERWLYYKDKKLIEASRTTITNHGTPTVYAEYSATAMEKEKAAINMKSRLVGNFIPSYKLFISQVQDLLYWTCNYGFDMNKFKLQFYSNGNKESLKFAGSYDHTIKYTDLDIANLTREEVQNEISQNSNLKSSFTINSHNNYSINLELKNVVKTKDGEKWIDRKVTQTETYKKGCNLNYPDLTKFKKLG